MNDISTQPDEILQGDSFDDITWSSLLLLSKRNQILKTLRESSHYDQNTFNELLNNTLKFKEENPLDYRTLWITKNNTSQTAYEFPLAEVDGHDRLSLYWFHLCESDRGNVIRVRCLRNNVTGHILKSKDFNIDRTLSKMKCKTRKQHSYENDHYCILSSEAQFSRFSRLYPYIVQCIILKTESKNKHVRILVEKEDKVILSYEKCVFVPYDSTVGHHNLVYLYNKIHEEEESNLKYDNVIAEAILRNFNDEQLKYESYVSFEDTSIIVQPTIQSNRYTDEIWFYVYFCVNDANIEEELGNCVRVHWQVTLLKKLPSSTSNAITALLNVFIHFNVTNKQYFIFLSKSNSH
ncbi:unnamed protein product [Rotaria sp. Silwood1]|nr:unnamed protein product [Rotaria sp. Silwood1]